MNKACWFLVVRSYFRREIATIGTEHQMFPIWNGAMHDEQEIQKDFASTIFQTLFLVSSNFEFWLFQTEKKKKIVLAIGNFMNSGAPSGRAYGFKLDVLNKVIHFFFCCLGVCVSFAHEFHFISLGSLIVVGWHQSRGQQNQFNELFGKFDHKWIFRIGWLCNRNALISKSRTTSFVND